MIFKTNGFSLLFCCCFSYYSSRAVCHLEASCVNEMYYSYSYELEELLPFMHYLSANLQGHHKNN